METKRTIITHVGTSALRCEALTERPSFEPRDLDRALQRELEPEDYDDLRQACREDLQEGLRETWGPHFKEADRRARSPAEIASLSLLNLTAEDQVVLLHPQSAGGAFCAELIALALQDSEIPSGLGYPKASKVTIAPVAGLRVTGDPRVDATAANLAAEFLARGVASYVAHVWEAYQGILPGGSLIFNITGSYKGLVPIARDVSLLLHGAGGRPVSCEVCYLFESGSELIRYPAFPIAARVSQDLLDDLERVSAEGGAGPELLKTRGEGEWAGLFERASETRLRLSAAGTVMRSLLPLLNQSL